MRFTSNNLPNAKLEINEFGVWIRVSLNIKPDLIKYLTKANVHKANKMFIFVISAKLKGSLTKDKMNIAYNNCLKTAMKCIREAKVEVIKNEIKTISNKQYQLF